MGKTTEFGTKVPAGECPSFGFTPQNIAAAFEEPATDDVSCGGVALQRVDCLKYGHVKSGEYCRKVGGLG
eukprot:3584455-Rhodomonas_salina.3